MSSRVHSWRFGFGRFVRFVLDVVLRFFAGFVAIAYSRISAATAAMVSPVR
jgi:hypothetical protein